jgi:hypothetical protein
MNTTNAHSSRQFIITARSWTLQEEGEEEEETLQR